VDEGGGDHAGAAGVCFVFHTALEGADGNVVGREHGGEIRVGAGGGERFVTADRAAVVEDVECIESFRAFDEGDDVRDAGVDEMERAAEAGDRGAGVELEVLGLGHGDADVLADHLGGEGAGDGFEGDFLENDFPEVGGEAAEAARAVAAHFGFAAVGVVVAETEIRAFPGGLHGEQAVGADAAIAVAERGDGVGVEVDGEVAVVNDDEVIAGAVHFEKVEEHGDGMI